MRRILLVFISIHFAYAQNTEKIIHNLHSGNWVERHCAAYKLSKITETPQLIVKALLTSLHDEDHGVRKMALWSLIKVMNRTKDKRCITVLMQKLYDKNTDVAFIMRQLQKFNNNHMPIFLYLIDFLEYYVTQATVYLPKNHSQTQALLSSLLEEPLVLKRRTLAIMSRFIHCDYNPSWSEEKMEQQLIQAVRELSTNNHKIDLSVTLQAISTENIYVKKYIETFLRILQTKAKQIDNKSQTVIEEIVKTLQHLLRNKNQQVYMPILLRKLKHEDLYLQKYIAVLLNQLPKKTPSYLLPLSELLPNSLSHSTLENIFVHVSHESPQVISQSKLDQRLVDIIRISTDLNIRDTTIRILNRMNTATPVVVNLWIDLLKDPKRYTRMLARKKLALMGEQAQHLLRQRIAFAPVVMKKILKSDISNVSSPELPIAQQKSSQKPQYKKQLLRLLYDDNVMFTEELNHLENYSQPYTLETLVQIVHQNNNILSIAAAQLLVDHNATQYLLALIKEKNSRIQRNVLRAMCSLKQQEEEIVDALMDIAIHSNSGFLRVQAIQSLHLK